MERQGRWCQTDPLTDGTGGQAIGALFDQQAVYRQTMLVGDGTQSCENLSLLH